MTSLWRRLRRRKLVQWAIAYLAAAWVLLQVVGLAADSYGWPRQLMQWTFALVALGFVLTLVLAWYHGEQGAQRVSGRELLLLALVLVVGGALIWRYGTVAEPGVATTAVADPGVNVPVVDPKSIAVLPFENLSADRQNEYFVSGMQDLILTKLAGIGELKVISRTSTEKYASRPENLRKVAAELGVAHILEGSVQRADDRVLINLQLIDARTDTHLWAESYERQMTDVFSVEHEVAGAVATAMHATLSPQTAARLASNMSEDAAANDAYLRAEYLVNQGKRNYYADGKDSLKAALPLYRQAIGSDPGFALAWARLSQVESSLAWIGGAGEDVAQLESRARADAEHALQLAPALAAARIAQGYVAYQVDADYPAAYAAFAAALKLKPNDAEAWAAQGYVQRREGRFGPAIDSLQHALALDPRNSALASELGTTYMMTSRFAEAVQAFRRSLSLDPDNLNAQAFHPFATLFASGDVARALSAAQGDSDTLKLCRVSLLSNQRRYAEALTLLESVADTPDNFYAPSGVSKALWQADLYRLMGDAARARALYGADLPKARAAVDATQKTLNQGQQWARVAADQLGLGQTGQALASIAKAQALVEQYQQQARVSVAALHATVVNAGLYAGAGRADLAQPLLARALADPALGYSYAPVLLWLDPAWDPIRDDPGFRALQEKYAQHKPAVPAVPVVTAAGTAR